MYISDHSISSGVGIHPCHSIKASPVHQIYIYTRHTCALRAHLVSLWKRYNDWIRARAPATTAIHTSATTAATATTTTTKQTTTMAASTRTTTGATTTTKQRQQPQQNEP